MKDKPNLLLKISQKNSIVKVLFVNFGLYSLLTHFLMLLYASSPERSPHSSPGAPHPRVRRGEREGSEGSVAPAARCFTLKLFLHSFSDSEASKRFPRPVPHSHLLFSSSWSLHPRPWHWLYLHTMPGIPTLEGKVHHSLRTRPGFAGWHKTDLEQKSLSLYYRPLSSGKAIQGRASSLSPTTCIKDPTSYVDLMLHPPSWLLPVTA